MWESAALAVKCALGLVEEGGPQAGRRAFVSTLKWGWGVRWRRQVVVKWSGIAWGWYYHDQRMACVRWYLKWFSVGFGFRPLWGWISVNAFTGYVTLGGLLSLSGSVSPSIERVKYFTSRCWLVCSKAQSMLLLLSRFSCVRLYATP